MGTRRWWQTCLHVIRIAVAVLALVTFTLVATLDLAAWTASQELTSPQTYEQAIQSAGLVDDARSYFSTALASLAGNKVASIPLLSQIPPAGWEAFMNTLLPDTWVEQTMGDMVQAVVVWLGDEKQPLPLIVIDLTPLQDTLRGPQGTQAFLQLEQYIPTCTGSQILSDLLSGQLNCLPAGLGLGPLAPVLAKAFAAVLPAQLTLSSPSLTVILFPGLVNRLTQIRLAYQLLRSGIALGLRLALFLFSLYCLAMTASIRVLPGQAPRRFLRALPWPFYTVGLASMLLIAGRSLFLGPLLTSVFSHNLVMRALNLTPIVVNLLSTLMDTVARPWLWWATGLLSVGIILHLLGLLVEHAAHRQRQKLPSREG